MQPLHAYQSPELPRFFGGAVGFLAYDIVRYFERLPTHAQDELGTPDLYLMFTDTVLIFDNVRQTLKIVANVALEDHPSTRAAYRAAAAKIDELIARLDAPARAPRLESAANLNGDAVNLVSNQTREGYMAMVEAAKEYIAAGDIIQVVPSQRFEAPLGSHPFNLYRSLRTINPSPYMFYLRLDDHTLVGASPEVMVRVEGREITLRPIAGTRRRGATEAEDRALERELLADPKERAEHVMLVDLGRNDVGRVAEIGSVEVTELMMVERYSHVMHIVSNVRGRAARGMRRVRRVSRHLPAGHRVGRAENPRDGDYRRTGAGAPRRLRRRGRLLQLHRQHRHRDRAPHHSGQKRPRLYPGRRRRGRRFRPRRRVRGIGQQGACDDSGAQRGARLRDRRREQVSRGAYTNAYIDDR